MLSMDLSTYIPTTDLRVKCRCDARDAGSKDKVKDPYISAWGPPEATGSRLVLAAEHKTTVTLNPIHSHIPSAVSV